jgi:hypothetical protein
VDRLDGLHKATLATAQPVAVAGRRVTLAWPESEGFSYRRAQQPAFNELIAQALRAVTGVAMQVEVTARPDDQFVSAPTAVLSEDELIERLKEEFDAEVLPTEREEA